MISSPLLLSRRRRLNLFSGEALSPLSPPPLRVPEIDLATNRRANDKADCDEDGCICISPSCQPICLWGKQTRRRGRQKKLEQSRARRQSTDQKRALALSLSLSLCVVVFKADLSLFNLSPFVSCGGKQQSVDTLTKEEAKKLEHKSRGVKKHEHRNCSESALFSLCVVFSLVLFRANHTRLFHPKSVEISSVSQQRSAFPHY